MMLIEADKRGEKNKIKLTYSADDDYFYVPDNIHIIGTMNTADRSLTIVDYALRRRFAFIKMIPKFNNQFEEFILSNGLSEGIIKKIVSKMSYLNQIIREDESLGDGFEIGHSYFCTFSSGNEKRWYNNVMEFEIIPLIKEYWFDDSDKVSQYSEELLN
jgi:5-methylcytosine-specific restriction endonuclease McrBC GTP-binding regulatory subunit McrB